ncbi:MAG: DciA family protein [Tepidamorphaceae bacterium]
MSKQDHGKRRTGFGARALGQLVPELIAPAAKRYGFSSADLLGQWPAIVGADVAGRCVPERIVWPRRAPDPESDAGKAAATLHLRARAEHILHVGHETDLIADRLNAYFGYQAIEKVIVHRDDSEPEQPEKPRESAASRKPEPVSGIRNDDLRAALGELGGHVREENE